MYLVGANICLTCAHGPYKKQVDPNPNTLPNVYIIAKGSGSPSISFINLNVLPKDIRNPTVRHIMQPATLC